MEDNKNPFKETRPHKHILHISKNPLEAHTMFRRVVENLCDYELLMCISAKNRIINTRHCLVYFRVDGTFGAHKFYQPISNIFGIDPIRAKSFCDYEDRAAALNFKGDILDCILMYEGIKR